MKFIFPALWLLACAVLMMPGQSAAQNRSADADALYQKGLALYEQGQYEAASKLFAQTLSLRHQEQNADYQRGLRLYEQGDYRGAQEAFQRAIDSLGKATIAAAPAAAAQKTPEILPPSPAPGTATAEYTLDSGDVLSIKIWQNPDLDDNDVIVRPDGMVSFTLAGDLPAKGKTIRAFRQDLTEALKEFIRAPQVSVSIKSMGGKKIMVLGQVAHPGIFAVTGPQTVIEAVTMAGGFTDHAVSSSVVLVRGGFEKPHPQRLDLNRALKKGDLKDNVVLASNDIIYVPKRFIADLNYFLTQFMTPIVQGLYIRDQLEDF